LPVEVNDKENHSPGVGDIDNQQEKPQPSVEESGVVLKRTQKKHEDLAEHRQVCTSVKLISMGAFSFNRDPSTRQALAKPASWPVLLSKGQFP